MQNTFININIIFVLIPTEVITLLQASLQV